MNRLLSKEIVPPIIVGASLLTLGLWAIQGDGKEEGVCVSPRAISDVYNGDETANPVDQNTWTNGIRIETHLSDKAVALIVGYRDPNEDEWHDSNQIPKLDSNTQAVKIGTGDVQFSTSIVAENGSSACNEKPDVTFSQPVEYKELIEEGASAPQWPS
jgi:hypothetical protein